MKTLEKESRRSEIPLVLLMLIPIVYLAAVWTSLPDIVPTHFNAKMEADDFGSKWFFGIMTIIWSPLIYLLMFYIPRLDPKKKLERNSKTYYIVRIAIQALMCGISCWIIYVTMSYEKTAVSFRLIPLLLSAFMIVLGNYMPRIKQNYFLGFRTPWTLESNEVWLRTHLYAGKAFFYGGIVSLVCSIFLPEQIAFIVLVSIISTIALWGVLYSFFLFRKLKKSNEEHV